MHQPNFVNGTESGGHLQQQVDRMRRRQGTFLQHFIERLAFDEFHRQVGNALIALADVEQARTSLMHDGGGAPGFGQQHAAELGLLREAWVQQLECDRHQGPDVLRAKHRAEAAAAEHRLQPVLAVDDRAEQRIAGIDLATARGIVHGIGRQQRRFAVATTVGLRIGHTLT